MNERKRLYDGGPSPSHPEPPMRLQHSREIQTRPSTSLDEEPPAAACFRLSRHAAHTARGTSSSRHLPHPSVACFQGRFSIHASTQHALTKCLNPTSSFPHDCSTLCVNSRPLLRRGRRESKRAQRLTHRSVLRGEKRQRAMSDDDEGTRHQHQDRAQRRRLPYAQHS